MILITTCLFLFCAATVTVGAYREKSPKEHDFVEVAINAVSNEPKQAALQVIDSYFTELKKRGVNTGTPVASYRVVELDEADPDRIRVKAAVTYSSSPEEMPATNFFIIKKGEQYIVESEKVVFDMISTSPTYGQIIYGAKINEVD